MTKKTVIHVCDKKEDLAEILKLTYSQEEKINGQNSKIDNIHKAIMGNGQPGLLAEWNQWKGFIKFIGLPALVSALILAIFK